MLPLIGILLVVVGFVLRINPLLVVTVAGLATGLASGLGPLAVVAAFGKAFITSRYVAIVWPRADGPPAHRANGRGRRDFGLSAQSCLSSRRTTA